MVHQPEDEDESLLFDGELESLESLLSLLELLESRLRLFDFFFLPFLLLPVDRLAPVSRLSERCSTPPRFCSAIFKLSAANPTQRQRERNKTVESMRNRVHYGAALLPGIVSSVLLANCTFDHRNSSELRASSCAGMMFRHAWYAPFASSMLCSSS